MSLSSKKETHKLNPIISGSECPGLILKVSGVNVKNGLYTPAEEKDQGGVREIALLLSFHCDKKFLCNKTPLLSPGKWPWFLMLISCGLYLIIQDFLLSNSFPFT